MKHDDRHMYIYIVYIKLHEYMRRFGLDCNSRVLITKNPEQKKSCTTTGLSQLLGDLSGPQKQEFCPRGK
jgi:hypothetical protein